MRKIFIILSLMIGTVAVAQEEKSPFVDWVHLSYEAGSGGGDYGLGIKANHTLWQKERLAITSGIALLSFYGSEGYELPWASARGYTADVHGRLHAGLRYHFLSSRKASVSLEAFAGGVFFTTSGQYEHPELGVDREYKVSESFLDYGSRLSVAYRIGDAWGLEAGISNSWAQIGTGMGPLIGLFAGQPDAKMSLGIGVSWFPGK